MMNSPRPPGARQRKPTGEVRNAKLAALEVENADLRERLNMREHQTLAIWQKTGTQEFRDRNAARALLGEWGNLRNAFIRLGFDIDHLYQEHIFDATREAVFGTPGVIEIMSRDLADTEARRVEILARITHTALYGTDDTSTRAAQMVARLAGWMTPEAAPQTTVNLYTLVGAGAGGRAGILAAKEAEELQKTIDSTDPLALLSHDPGAPTRITVEDDNVNELIERRS